MSEDPIGFSGCDYNLYRYVGNNPLKYEDPYGLWFANIVGGLLGAGYAAATGGSAGEIAIAGVIGFATAGLSLPFQIGLELLLSTQQTDPNTHPNTKTPDPDAQHHAQTHRDGCVWVSGSGVWVFRWVPGSGVWVFCWAVGCGVQAICWAVGQDQTSAFSLVLSVRPRCPFKLKHIHPRPWTSAPPTAPHTQSNPHQNPQP